MGTDSKLVNQCWLMVGHHQGNCWWLMLTELVDDASRARLDRDASQRVESSRWSLRCCDMVTVVNVVPRLKLRLSRPLQVGPLSLTIFQLCFVTKRQQFFSLTNSEEINYLVSVVPFSHLNHVQKHCWNIAQGHGTGSGHRLNVTVVDLSINDDMLTFGQWSACSVTCQPCWTTRSWQAMPSPVICRGSVVSVRLWPTMQSAKVSKYVLSSFTSRAARFVHTFATVRVCREILCI